MSKKTTTKKTAAKATKTTKAAKQPKAKAAKTPAKKREGKMSALDAAVQVLAGSKEPLNTKTMIEQMAAIYRRDHPQVTIRSISNGSR